MKTITFRHLKYVSAVHGSVPIKKLEQKLISDLLLKGYLPAGISYQRKKLTLPYEIRIIDLDMVFCCSAFVGKKSAPILFKENEKLLRGLKYGE